MPSRLMPFRPLLLVILSLLAFLPLTAQAPQASTPPPANPRRIIAAIPEDFPPTYYKDPVTGQPTGFAVDLLREIGKLEGFQVEFRFGRNWEELHQMLQDGRADVIPNHSVTTERNTRFAFTRDVETSPIDFFARASSPADLRPSPGQRVGVVRGSIAAEMLGDWPGLTAIVYADQNRMLFDLLAGRIDLALSTNNFEQLAFGAGVHDRLRRLQPSVAEARRAMALRRNDTETLERLNRGIDTLMATPRFQELYRKWWARPSSPMPLRRILAWAGLGACLLLGGMAWWRYRSIRRLARDLAAEIQERRRTEEILTLSEQKFRALIENMCEGVALHELVLDPSGRPVDYRILDVNPAFQRHTGLDATQAVGSLASAFYGLPEPPYLGVYADVAQGGHPVVFDTFYPPLDRHLRISVICPKAGQFATVFEDITDRKRTEEALRTSEARNRALIRAMPDLIFLNRKDGTFLDVNVTDANRLLVEPERFLQRRVEEVLPEALARRIMDAYSLALESGALQEICYTLPRPEGERTYEARVVPCTEDTVVTLIRDITAYLQAEEQQRHLEAQLLQARKMDSLGSLAGGVAHDMNNVLGAILGLASANLPQHPEGSPARQAFETIVKASERGRDMVRGLLNFARQTTAEEREVRLNDLIREEARLLERTTLAKVRLELDLAPDLRPVLGDPAALTHLLMNLWVNAVDAMPEQGTLTLRTRNEGGEAVLVQVRDTGTGMPREVLERAMDPFFTTKESGKGTGLGLSLVYSIVKAHGGRIDLESEPGRGTCVSLRFPAAQAAAEQAPAAQASAPSPALHVLVVDDDELVQSALGMLLEVLGHRCSSARSGEEALSLLEGGLAPGLVILDMNMPGMGGRGALPRLRDLRPGLPVLVATGRVDQTALDLVDRFGGVLLLPKPFTMEELQARIREVLAEG